MTRIAEIADRLHRLAKRREDDGIYTDAALCEEAAAYLTAALAAEPGEAVQGYCSDCECTGPITNGRCRCGSARIAPSAHHLPLKEEVERMASYAEGLAAALWEKHWKEDSPDWKPLSGDLIGLLTQIDNMTTGLSRMRAGTQEGWRQKIEEIRARVERTICPTFSSDSGDIGEQGRISREDFDTLVISALGNAAPSPEAKGGRS